ncbi:LytR family transcriptional regulator [Clostridium gelidum]|uniref:LytR family transcriptional regulator n=1 Tax=Clostridium gelidum TaxID=704125 RepID=A0ABM7TDR5_9CLOT|nr:LCP family protein [Clostridium gelidum]BCZ47060.1 LytR family transcriptional regulator [Clostridium gelidum]
MYANSKHSITISRSKHKWHKHRNKHSKKKKMPYKKIFFYITFILCLTLLGLLITTNENLSKINKVDINKNNFDLKADNSENNINETLSKTNNTIIKDTNITNIALLGIDETEGTAGRSDCIMILTIDNQNNKLKISSIIRDSYVTIPTINKKDKINHAYAFGGSQLALQTINQNFNLNLDKVIVVNFSSLPQIIDTFGGIQLKITSEELKYINNYIYNLNELNHTNSPNIVTSGNQLVDGTQSLAYCRIRYTDGGDFERSQRQRTLLSNLIEKCATIPLTEYPSLDDKIFPLIYTNLKKSELLTFAVNLNSSKSLTILQDRFPKDEDSSGKLIDGIYYYVFDKELTTKKIHQFIFSTD